MFEDFKNNFVIQQTGDQLFLSYMIFLGSQGSKFEIQSAL
jgi:hypothetical protein